MIAGEAAKYLKPCVFELGGKAPAVVLADAAPLLGNECMLFSFADACALLRRVEDGHERVAPCAAEVYLGVLGRSENAAL